MTIEFIAILALVVICILLVFDRYFDKEQHQREINRLLDESQKNTNRLLDELSKATKAVISKNANEYVMTAAIDKVSKEEGPRPESDLVEPDSLTDDEFDATLGIKRTSQNE